VIASLTLILAAAIAPGVGIAAPFLGIAGGAYLAGKVAKFAGLYHGTLTAVAYIVAATFGLAPVPLEPLLGGGVAESVWIIVGDLLLLAVAAAAGWLGSPRRAPSSSLDRDRDR
jgi:hypothetical protein